MPNPVDSERTYAPLPLLPAKNISRGKFDISYVDVGKVGNPIVVLCHGLASSGQQFSDDASFFVKHGFRVILPDLRGHGRSNVPDQIVETDFSIKKMADDLIAVLDDADAAQVHYVGNSLGGILALSLLPEHAERFISCTTFGTSFALMTPSFNAETIPKIFEFIGPEWADHLIAKGTSKKRATQELVHELLDCYDLNVVSYVAKNVGNYDFSDYARNFKKPIMMLRGGQDNLVNAALLTTLNEVQKNPNFILIEIPNGGHCANLDATSEVRIALLGFFKTNDI